MRTTPRLQIGSTVCILDTLATRNTGLAGCRAVVLGIDRQPQYGTSCRLQVWPEGYEKGHHVFVMDTSVQVET